MLRPGSCLVQLAAWPAAEMTSWLAGRPAGWLAAWPAGWLAGWPACGFTHVWQLRPEPWLAAAVASPPLPAGLLTEHWFPDSNPSHLRFFIRQTILHLMAVRAVQRCVCSAAVAVSQALLMHHA